MRCYKTAQRFPILLKWLYKCSYKFTAAEVLANSGIRGNKERSNALTLQSGGQECAAAQIWCFGTKCSKSWAWLDSGTSLPSGPSASKLSGRMWWMNGSNSGLTHETRIYVQRETKSQCWNFIFRFCSITKSLSQLESKNCSSFFLSFFTVLL